MWYRSSWSKGSTLATIFVSVVHILSVRWLKVLCEEWVCLKIWKFGFWLRCEWCFRSPRAVGPEQQSAHMWSTCARITETGKAGEARAAVEQTCGEGHNTQGLFHTWRTLSIALGGTSWYWRFMIFLILSAESFQSHIACRDLILQSVPFHVCFVSASRMNSLLLQQYSFLSAFLWEFLAAEKWISHTAQSALYCFCYLLKSRRALCKSDHKRMIGFMTYVVALDTRYLRTCQVPSRPQAAPPWGTCWVPGYLGTVSIMCSECALWVTQDAARELHSFKDTDS